MFNVPEQYRVPRGPFRSTVKDGNNGVFIVPSKGGSDHLKYQVIADDCRNLPEEAKKLYNPETTGIYWEHISVGVVWISGSGNSRDEGRCPRWDEMCYIKELFWDDPEDVVLQFHPPASEYVNNHPYVLHLWRAVDINGFPVRQNRPPSIMVGLKPEPKEAAPLQLTKDEMQSASPQKLKAEADALIDQYIPPTNNHNDNAAQ